MVKVGRTQYQDAVLTTLGREMGAYAEALNRDRWRIYKCEERLRVVNLGGTAIGTGFAAPRQYIFRVVDTLRELTSIGFARAENLIEATQNTDVFVEVVGHPQGARHDAAQDLRRPAPAELRAGGRARRDPPARGGRPARSIMPGKVNPVIPEAVSQVALLVAGYDATIAMAAGLGSLELNAFLPLIADCLLQSLSLLARADEILRRFCVEGLEADEERCARARARLQRRRHRPGARDRLRGGLRRRARRAGRGRDDPRRRRRQGPAQRPSSTTSCSRPRPSAASARPSRSADPWRTDGGRTMGMMDAPRGMRLHIGIFGRRNVGKSSLLNAITRQDVSIVSDFAGTTTDPVEKPMELLPLGPVLFIDTAGIDDVGVLGELRAKRTMQVFDRTDLGVLVTEAGSWGEYEDGILDEFQERKTPVVVVFNKADLVSKPAPVKRLQDLKVTPVLTAASEGRGVLDFRQALLDAAPPDFIDNPTILGDLVNSGDLAVLVVPIDKEAPRGRLILPQVQSIRDLMDSDAMALVVKERELKNAIDRLNRPPKLVVTDSQAFLKVAADTPPDVPLTSFSILFSRFKGDLTSQVEGTLAVDDLKSGDHILIAEACSHHPIAEDIGRVKIPRWLTQYVGGKLEHRAHAGPRLPRRPLALGPRDPLRRLHLQPPRHAGPHPALPAAGRADHQLRPRDRLQPGHLRARAAAVPGRARGHAGRAGAAGRARTGGAGDRRPAPGRGRRRPLLMAGRPQAAPALGVADALTRDAVEYWLREDDEARLETLWAAADEAPSRYVGDAVHLRGLVEVSNYCVRGCTYCGIRAGNRGVERYRVSAEVVLECARKAEEFGYGTLVMQAGEDYGIETRAGWPACCGASAARPAWRPSP